MRQVEAHRFGGGVGTGRRGIGVRIAALEDGEKRDFRPLRRRIQDEDARFEAKSAVELDVAACGFFGEGAAVNKFLRLAQARNDHPFPGTPRRSGRVYRNLGKGEKTAEQSQGRCHGYPTSQKETRNGPHAAGRT